MSTRLLALSIGIALGTFGMAAAQAPPPGAPSLAEAEAVWSAFWSHLSLGDLEGARTFVYSGRRHLYPRQLGPKELRRMQALADQMAFCRLVPTPFIGEHEAWYLLQCRFRDETALGQVILRRDYDGVWRLLVAM